MRRIRIIIPAAVAAFLVLAAAAAMQPASAGTTATARSVTAGAAATARSAITTPPASATASTVILHRPDGGNNGNWAQDDFTRTAYIHRAGPAGLANCPGQSTGHCYTWTFKITDSGHFITEPAGGPPAYNGLSPRTGTALLTQVIGSFSGGTKTGTFFTDTQAPNSSLVPATEDDGDALPTGRQTTTNWVEQFFGPAAVFNSAANPGGPDLGDWSWTYTAGFGQNTACRNDAYRWVDANPSGGTANTDGDILAPDAAHCT